MSAEVWTIIAKESLSDYRTLRTAKMRERAFSVVDGIGALAVSDDGIATATINKSKIPYHRDVVYAVFDDLTEAGLLVRIKYLGKNGTKYRLLFPPERDVNYVQCQNSRTRWFPNVDCERWIPRDDVPTPDILALSLEAARREMDPPADEILILCRPCRSHDSVHPEGTCPGCGDPDTPCYINGRPVCVHCFTRSLGDDYLREIMAERNGTIDLTPLVRLLDGLTLT